MSVKIWSWREGITKSQLPPTTRHVLLTLSIYMNEKGEGCYPSVETLAEDTGLHCASIYRAIKDATKRGWLVKRKLGKGGRTWAANEYEAAFPAGFALAEREPSHNASPRGARAKGSHSAKRGVAQSETNSPRELSREPDAARAIAYAGKVISISREQFDEWQATFHAIPDLRADLMSIDSHCVRKGIMADWETRIVSWLSKKHEKILLDRAADAAKATSSAAAAKRFTRTLTVS